MKRFAVLSALIVFAVLSIPCAFAQSSKNVYAIYFTGIGCPHCAKSDPVVLQEMIAKHPELVIIEYEIYHESRNAKLLNQYCDWLDLPPCYPGVEPCCGIPLIIFSKSKDNIIAGDMPIINRIEDEIKKNIYNNFTMISGSKSFNEIDFTTLKGSITIWTKDRVLVSGNGGNNDLLKELLTSENISSTLKNTEFSVVTPDPVPLSGSYVNFEHAIMMDNWRFQWNGEGIGKNESSNTTENNMSNNQTTPNHENDGGKITIVKIISLAALDAINPCALAVLTLILIAIITYNPMKKRNILLAGAAFTFSVFVMYIFYGLVIIRFFQIVQALTSVRLTLYRILGIAATIIGILNIKDFLHYKPGGMMTEMPIRMRSKVKKIIEGITSPKGAFTAGAFVTIFLLPCTIGPYIIAGGILSFFEIIQIIPWLIVYNLVFVLPMIIITVIVFFGVSRVEDISGWKDKNIRYLHLTSGIIIFLIGIAMATGLF